MVESEHLDKGVGVEAEPTGASAPVTSPAPPDPASLDQGRERIRKYGRRGRVLDANEEETVCLLTAAGLDLKRISEILDCYPKRVTGTQRRQKRRILQITGERILEQVRHEYGLPALLPKSREVLAKTLDYGSEKERVSTAKWVHESLIAKPTQKSEVKVEAKVEHDLRPMIEQMGEHLRVLRERVQERDPLARVVVGTASKVRQQLGSGE